MARVAPSERFRAGLDEALAGVGQQQDPVEMIGRLGARLILQQALEDEVTEFLGRALGARRGEGLAPQRLRAAEGTHEEWHGRARAPARARRVEGGLREPVPGRRVTRTYALEWLVVGSFLRGLWTRDVEAVLEETFEEPISSRSTVSRILEDTRERYRRWCERRLEDGRDLVARGLRPPAMVIADGAPGPWRAVRELWPAADEQRCTVHALRNVTSKLPERHHRELKARWWKVFDEAARAAEARRGLQAIIADYRSAYPSAMAVIERDLDALVAHLRWPSEHASGSERRTCCSAPSSRSPAAPR